MVIAKGMADASPISSNSYILVFLSVTRQEEGGSTGRAWNEHETSCPDSRQSMPPRNLSYPVQPTKPLLCRRQQQRDEQYVSCTSSSTAPMHILAMLCNAMQCHATASHSSHLSCLPPQAASCSSPVLTERLLSAWKCNVGQGEKRLEFVSNARHGLACSAMQGMFSFNNLQGKLIIGSDIFCPSELQYARNILFAEPACPAML